jgi:hypothetical protein
MPERVSAVEAGEQSRQAVKGEAGEYEHDAEHEYFFGGHHLSSIASA